MAPKRSIKPRTLSTFEELTNLIEEARPALTPSQLRLANLVIDGPQQLALSTAAELAKRAEMDESTVVRFAQAIGLSGYPALRDLCATELQRQAGLLTRYDSMKSEAFGDEDLFETMSTIEHRNIDRTAANVDLASWKQIVEIVATSRSVYVMGLRACFSMAHLLSFQLSLVRDQVRLVTDLDGTIPEQLSHLTDEDVFIAITLAPYTTQTLKVAKYAATRGCRTVAFTDRRSSPLARTSANAVLVDADGPLLMPSMTALTYVLQTLIVAVSETLNTDGAKDLERVNAVLAAFDTHTSASNSP
ncbi:MurR/RpiR family transcriptional regulator [Pseudarthrobacter sp. AB1]|uniref:MurR/RpiR family transcriptional regulator n=1 Tax=Pseudarthrobacter sp. AB1 TaxID=2138309 RepID=UPI00186B9545|nr:MurR/RpiR family transcriptional regulator [Pseudarthrobacter sp. AB1]MBE4719528.1 hypothetical protein [Pseudarthrobacter sp. AB1]